MTTEKYLPTDVGGMLGHVVEECGEVCMAIGKTFRFGLESYNPEVEEDKRETNAEWILREIDDLELSINRLRDELTHNTRGDDK